MKRDYDLLMKLWTLHLSYPVIPLAAVPRNVNNIPEYETPTKLTILLFS
jgi:hypothetical protein